MDYYLLGIDHQSAEPALRAKFHLSPKRISQIYDFRRVPPETVILSTCNRTEFYFYSDMGPTPLQEILADIYPDQMVDLTNFYQKKGVLAISHLIRLAVGLQSMIAGETEILGQLDAAYQLAVKSGNVSESGPLGRLFRKIPEYARYIRKKSRIGAFSSSLATLVCREVKQYFRNQDQSLVKMPPKALILGNGAIAQKISRVFTFQGIPVAIASRNRDAQRERFGEVLRYGWEDLGQALDETDIVVAATTAPHFLLKKEHFEQLNGKVLIDLAFPRNIDPVVTSTVNCVLWDLAYFGEKSGANQVLKRQAMEKAEHLCFEATKRFQATKSAESRKSKVNNQKLKPKGKTKDYHEDTKTLRNTKGYCL